MKNPFFTIPDIFRTKRILCVQPHPDDMDISIGGTIRLLANGGAEIHYLTVTDDSAGFLNSGSSLRERADIRKEEQKAAGEVLGVSFYHWLDLPDAGVWSHHEARNGIIDIIRNIKPEVLLTVDPFLAYEVHMDHIRTGRAASEAALLYNMPHIGNKIPEGYEPFDLAAVGYVWTNNPNTVIDTTAVNEIKFEAVAKHRSQFPGVEGFEQTKAYLTYRASIEAGGKDFALGESMKLLPPIMLHCFPEAEGF